MVSNNDHACTSQKEMSLSLALGTLGLRGLESSQEGAQILANQVLSGQTVPCTKYFLLTSLNKGIFNIAFQVAGAIHHIEERREANLKLMGRKKPTGR